MEDKQASRVQSFSNFEILREIWVLPREVFKFLDYTNNDKLLNYLLFLAGVLGGFNRASNNNLGDTQDLIYIIMIAVAFGGGLGWISYYLYAALLSWTGTWMGGKGKTKQLLRVVAHGMIPAITTLFLLVIQMILFEEDIFRSNFDTTDYSGLGRIIFWTTLIFQFLLGIYTIILIVIGISVVQNFSMLKAFLNTLLPAILIIGIVLLILLPFGIFGS